MMREVVSGAIEIVAVPPGEAPEAVRAAWVGLKLPLALTVRVVNFGPGVLTQSEKVFVNLFSLLRGQWQRQEGYLVPARAAVMLLEIAHPEAAQWWHENTPHLLRAPGQNLLFAAEVCRVIPITEIHQEAWPPPPRMDGEHSP